MEIVLMWNMSFLIWIRKGIIDLFELRGELLGWCFDYLILGFGNVFLCYGNFIRKVYFGGEKEVVCGLVSGLDFIRVCVIV